MNKETLSDSILLVEYYKRKLSNIPLIKGSVHPLDKRQFIEYQNKIQKLELIIEYGYNNLLHNIRSIILQQDLDNIRE